MNLVNPFVFTATMPAIPTSGLALYLRSGMGIDSASWLDQSGGGHTATLENGAAPGATGGFNGVAFDGIDDIATIPSTLGMGIDDVTIFARANFATTSLFGAILNIGSAIDGYHVGVGDTGSSTMGNNLCATLNGVTSIGSGVAIGTGIHTVGLVIPPSSSDVLLYLDGLLVYTGSGTANTPTAQSSIGAEPGDALSLPGPIYQFEGIILDALAYNRALSDAEILTLHTNL